MAGNGRGANDRRNAEARRHYTHLNRLARNGWLKRWKVKVHPSSDQRFVSTYVYFVANVFCSSWYRATYLSRATRNNNVTRNSCTANKYSNSLISIRRVV